MYSCSHTIDDIENEESFDVTFFGSVTVDNQNVIHLFAWADRKFC